MRTDGRRSDQLRPIKFDLDYLTYPEGSVLVTQGNTIVLCNATVEEGIPRWKQVQGISGGWITGDYSMLPRATHTRTPRETSGLSGRTQEIRRLIGRSLRTAINLEMLGPRTIILDCDVIQADGGTRTAAITGSFVALSIAVHNLSQNGKVPPDTIQNAIAAVSVGVVDGIPMLDLCYQEDSTAQVDANIVMNSAGEYLEFQGTAEKKPIDRQMLNQLLDLAYKGIGELLAVQRAALDSLSTNPQK